MKKKRDELPGRRRLAEIGSLVKLYLPLALLVQLLILAVGIQHFAFERLYRNVAKPEPLIVAETRKAPSPPPVVALHPLLKHKDDKAFVLPGVLTRKDREFYRQIFEAQKQNDWEKADRLQQLVSNKVLMGQVLAARYLSEDYDTNTTELALWLSQYNDMPNASILAGLASRKGAESEELMFKPVSSRPLRGGIGNGGRAQNRDYASAHTSNWKDREAARLLWSRTQEYVRKGRMDEALALIHSPQNLNVLSSIEYDLCLWNIASGYFAHGDDAMAHRVSSASARRSGEVIPGVHWVAGITAWRQNNYGGAAKHFAAMADHDALISPWDTSAAAYWAYRSYDRVGNQKRAQKYLHQAAANPRTFYGILARKKLGIDLGLDVKPAMLTKRDITSLYSVPGVRRAIAYMEVGEPSLAEQELRHLFPQRAYVEQQQLLSLAMALNLATVQMPMGQVLAKTDGRYYDYAAYPIPGWQPEKGFQVSPALIFALARQESGFSNKALSPSGAQGLMQLMPETANYVMRKLSADSSNLVSVSGIGARASLNEPIVNVTLGETYVRDLMEQPMVRNNLFYLAASYNAGPGKVAEWQNNIRYSNDPLLFMESIPYAETRNYIGQVMASYWIYAELLGEKNTSLQALANNRWPQYSWGEQRVAAAY